jgi:hypothetical protein
MCTRKIINKIVVSTDVEVIRFGMAYGYVMDLVNFI